MVGPIVALSIAAAVAGVLVYAVFVEPNWLRIRRRVLYLPKWDVRLDGLTILHLSDLHIGTRACPAERFLRVAKKLKADLVLFTGDFIAGPTGLERACVALGQYSRHRNVYGVPGNHEHAEYQRRFPGKGQFKAKRALDTGHIFQALEDAGVTMLVNRGVTVEHGSARFTLAGIADMFNEADDLDAALGFAESDESDSEDARREPVPVVLMSHSPDVLGNAARRGVSLVLSGHTHGGQVRFPLLGTPTTATFLPMERPSGVIVRGSTVMHVSPGLGTTFLPLRFFARPEVTLLELRSSGS